MAEESKRYEIQPIEQMIMTIRGQRVILDSDLARIYGVHTRRLNEQVRRNTDRFPPDFAFVLKDQKVTNLKSQIATSSCEGNQSQFLIRSHVGDAIDHMFLLNMELSSPCISLTVVVTMSLISMSNTRTRKH